MELRYKTLALSSLVLFCFYFIYDFPAALNKQLKLGNNEFGAQHISMLYSVYAFPNMIVPLFFGYSIKKQVQKAMVGLCFLVFLGQTIFGMGVYLSNFYTMLFGRFIYGIGGESFSVIQSKLITEHFEGKELALSMAITNSVARCGTITNFLITPLIAQYLGKSYSCALGSVFTAIAVILCVIIQKIHTAMENEYLKQTKTALKTNNMISDALIVHKGIEPLDFVNLQVDWNRINSSYEESFQNTPSEYQIQQSKNTHTSSKNNLLNAKKSDIISNKQKQNFDEHGLYYKNTKDTQVDDTESLYEDWSDSCAQNSLNSSDNSINNFIFESSAANYSNDSLEIIESPEAEVWAQSIDIDSHAETSRPFLGKDSSKNISKSKTENLDFHNKETAMLLCSNSKPASKNKQSSGFVLLVCISFMFAVSWAPYSNIATVLLQQRYSLTTILSGRMLAIQEGSSLVMTIILGFLSDIFGQKLYMVGIGGILMIIGHLFLFRASGSPFVPIAILSIAGPLISCYWPCITYLVTPESIGGGFAIFTCILNIAYTVSPLIVSTLVLNDKSLGTVQFFMIGTAGVAFVFICILAIVDRKQKLRLNRRSFSEKERCCIKN